MRELSPNNITKKNNLSPSDISNNTELDNDIKLLGGREKLIQEADEIKKKIKLAKNIISENEANVKILEFDLQEIEKQIAAYEQSMLTNKRDKKVAELKKIAGKKNVDDVNKFENRDKKPENDPKIEAVVNKGFIDDLKKFKEDKGYE